MALQHLKFLGGKDPEELWWLTNTTVPGLILLMVLPRWKHTKTISLLGPLIMALVYSLGFFSLVLYPEHEPDPNASFTSLEGVVALFKDEAGVFIGWVHFIVFDGLVARWMVLDSVEKGTSTMLHILIVIPCLIIGILAGPLGFLLYMILKNFIPDSTVKKNKNE